MYGAVVLSPIVSSNRSTSLNDFGNAFWYKRMPNFGSLKGIGDAMTSS